jgi:hypothetical protein
MFGRKRRTPRSHRNIEWAPIKPEIFELQRRHALKMLHDRERDFGICMTCRTLFEMRPPSPDAPRQRCRCEPADPKEWRSDLTERAHLCGCCRLELLRSGSRWSVWFCDECKERVRELNARLGRYVIPIGRHSMMAGVGVPGQVLVNATEEELVAISEVLRSELQGMVSSIDRLTHFASERTDELARLGHLDGLPSIALDSWFDVLRRLAESDDTVSKEASFRALVRWFGDPSTATH